MQLIGDHQLLREGTAMDTGWAICFPKRCKNYNHVNKTVQDLHQKALGEEGWKKASNIVC